MLGALVGVGGLAAANELVAFRLVAFLNQRDAVFHGNSLDRHDALRLATFDAYWQALDKRYPYFGRKAIDWVELGKQYRSAVPVVEESIHFYHLLAGLLAELNDSHVSLRLPEEFGASDGRALVSLDDRPGLELVSIGGRVHVAAWPAGDEPTPPPHLPESERGLPELVAVEGARAVVSLLSVLFRGEPESYAELLLRWQDGTLTHHALRRPAGLPVAIRL